MLFQIADCIFNDIWGGTEIFSVLGSERFKSDPEPRPGGALGMRLALMLGGQHLGVTQTRSRGWPLGSSNTIVSHGSG